MSIAESVLQIWDHQSLKAVLIKVVHVSWADFSFNNIYVSTVSS